MDRHLPSRLQPLQQVMTSRKAHLLTLGTILFFSLFAWAIYYVPVEVLIWCLAVVAFTAFYYTLYLSWKKY